MFNFVYEYDAATKSSIYPEYFRSRKNGQKMTELQMEYKQRILALDAKLNR